ncbi:hypothetical protein [Aureliella helgolandensis]|uniref:hypothetical protein n=1 Tax=Aureliella helgolandensis TaxID=2527968 RepID=UPI0011AB0930|nr:hypothetical protein [Aureliella helgolandensis]
MTLLSSTMQPAQKLPSDGGSLQRSRRLANAASTFATTALLLAWDVILTVVVALALGPPRDPTEMQAAFLLALTLCIPFGLFVGFCIAPAVDKLFRRPIGLMLLASILTFTLSIGTIFMLGADTPWPVGLIQFAGAASLFGLPMMIGCLVFMVVCDSLGSRPQGPL